MKYTKRELNKKSKTWLVNHAVISQRFLADIQRIMFYDGVSDTIEEILKDSYSGKGDRSEFWGALKFLDKYHNKCLSKLNYMNELDEYISVKEKWGFANWYKSFTLPEEENE